MFQDQCGNGVGHQSHAPGKRSRLRDVLPCLKTWIASNMRVLLQESKLGWGKI